MLDFPHPFGPMIAENLRNPITCNPLYDLKFKISSFSSWPGIVKLLYEAFLEQSIRLRLTEFGHSPLLIAPKDPTLKCRTVKSLWLQKVVYLNVVHYYQSNLYVLYFFVTERLWKDGLLEIHQKRPDGPKMNSMQKFDLSHKSVIRTPTKPQDVEICESLRPDDNTQGNI